MSYRLDLDEYDEKRLLDEISRRARLRLEGRCDYCGRIFVTDPCKFPDRHRPHKTQMARAKRVADTLRIRPMLLAEVVELLELDVPRCVGHQGPCGRPVLGLTPAHTAYEWDGEGEDPNQPLALCPWCSAGYAEQMQDQWDEYYAGRI